jgi:protein-S-isoprenylcysteine O-methyltransferase Ste14
VTPYLQQESWARVAFGMSVAAFAVGEISQAVKRRRGASGTDLVTELAFRCVFAIGVVMLPLSRTLVPGAVLPGVMPVLVGGLVGWLGLALRWWSFVTLGGYFTTVVRVSVDQEVVGRGPYRWLRHPSYSGLLAALLGAGLMLGNWAGAAACSGLVLIALVGRLIHEERVLAAALGDAYLDFARTRARLLPHVW